MDQIERIAQATENLLNSISLIKTSTAGGTQKVIIPATPFQVAGTAQVCRACLLHCPTGNTGDIHLTIKDELADTDDWLIPKGVAIPIPISDVSKLHFIGANADDVIHILWRN